MLSPPDEKIDRGRTGSRQPLYFPARLAKDLGEHLLSLGSGPGTSRGHGSAPMVVITNVAQLINTAMLSPTEQAVNPLQARSRDPAAARAEPARPTMR